MVARAEQTLSELQSLFLGTVHGYRHLLALGLSEGDAGAVSRWLSEVLDDADETFGERGRVLELSTTHTGA